MQRSFVRLGGNSGEDLPDLPADAARSIASATLRDDARVPSRRP